MTFKEFSENCINSLSSKPIGFSVKKIIAVIVVFNMIFFTWFKTDKDTFLVVLTAWLAFVTSLVVTGAIEKNIKASNETKQILNTSKDEPKSDS